MTSDDLRALLDAAGKATPGPWNIEHGRYLVAQDCYSFHSNGVLRNNFGISSASYSNVVCTVPGNQNERLPQPAANITYIAAASPEIIAALARIALAAQECDLTLSRVIHELAGAASLCWEPKPTGVFDSQLAISVCEKAIEELRAILRSGGLLATAPQETK